VVTAVQVPAPFRKRPAFPADPVGTSPWTPPAKALSAAVACTGVLSPNTPALSYRKFPDVPLPMGVVPIVMVVAGGTTHDPSARRKAAVPPGDVGASPAAVAEKRVNPA